MRRFAQKAIQEFHWSVNEFMETDFYELMEIMQAKSEEEMPVDPTALG
ncbi:hypothetical protein AALH12_07540 [Streptococcus ferus]